MSEIEVDNEAMPPREVIEYLEIPLRRPLLTLVPFVLFTAGGIGMYLNTPKWYQSSTLILIESEKVPELLTKTVIEKSADRIRVLKQEMLSRTRLERIVRELEPYPEYTGKRATSEVVEYMRGLVDIKVKGDDAFTISYVHKQPYLAMAVTSRLATLFIEEAGQQRQAQLATAAKFIQGTLDQAREAVEDKEKQLRALKAKYLGALPEELQSNLSALTRLQTERQTVSTSTSAAEERALMLEKAMNEEMSKAMPVQMQMASVSPTRQALDKLRGQLVDLRARYTDQHPEVRRVIGQISRLEKQLVAEANGTAESGPALPTPPPNPAVASLQTQLASARIEIAAMKQRSEEIAARIADVEQKVANTPAADAEISNVTRDYDKLQSNYQAILAKKLDAEMAESMEKQWKGLRYRMLDPAYLPDRPYSPQIGKFLGIGIGIGLALGLGAAIVAELLDHSIKNARELEVVLPHPLLVTVPHMSRRRTRPRPQQTEKPATA